MWGFRGFWALGTEGFRDVGFQGLGCLRARGFRVSSRGLGVEGVQDFLGGSWVFIAGFHRFCGLLCPTDDES